MGTDNTKQPANAADATLFLGEDWFDPLEVGVRGRIRGFIEEMLKAELDEALSRRRYQRRLAEGADREQAPCRQRNGHSGSEIGDDAGTIRACRHLRNLTFLYSALCNAHSILALHPFLR
jgi:hypothetical protein